MSTNDTPAASRTDDLVPADDTASRADTAARPPRPLLDPIAEAVRAAHAASVPF